MRPSLRRDWLIGKSMNPWSNRAIAVVSALLVLSSSSLGVAHSQSGKPATGTEEGSKKVKSEKLADSQGRVFWLVDLAGVEYRIPEEFVATIGRTGVDMRIHWPSKRGIRAVPADTVWASPEFPDTTLSIL